MAAGDEVTDPMILQYLRNKTAPASGGGKEVTDPMVLQHLRAQTAGAPERSLEAGELGQELLKGGKKGLAETAGLINTGASWVAKQAGYNLPNISDTQTYKDWTELPEADTTVGRYARRIGEFAGSALPIGGPLGLSAKLAARFGPEAGIWGLRALSRTSVPRMVGTEGAAAVAGGAASQKAEDAESGPAGQFAAGIVGGFGGAAGFNKGLRMLGAMGESGAVRLPGRGLGRVPQPPDRTQVAPPGAPEFTPEVVKMGRQDIADRMLRAGINREAGDQWFQTGDAAHVFWPGTNSPTGEMIAHMDPELARELGAQMRLHTGASRLGTSRLTALQTGETPALGMDTASGITTYQKGDPNLVAFRTGVTGGDLPEAAGQHARLMEGLNRASLTQSMAHHGYGETSAQTAANIVARQAEQSDVAYPALRAAANGIDVGGHSNVQSVVDELVARSQNPMIGKTRQAALKEVLDEMAPMVNGQRRVSANIDDVDRAKQVIDESIEGLRVSSGNTARLRMNEMRDARSKIVGAVDDIETNGIGKKYQDARSAHASEEELLHQLELGANLRKASNGDRSVNATIDDYNAYRGDRVAQSRIRHGFNGEVARELGGMRPREDASKLFDTPDQQRMINALLSNKNSQMMPANQGRRFFDFMTSLQQEQPTRNIAMGGSQTARNIQDDKIADALHTMRDIFQGGVTGGTKRAAEYIMQSAFGRGSDVAASIANDLTSTDVLRNRQAWAQIRMLIGRNKLLRLADRLELAASRHGHKTIGALPGSGRVAAEDK